MNLILLRRVASRRVVSTSTRGKTYKVEPGDENDVPCGTFTRMLQKARLDQRPPDPMYRCKRRQLIRFICVDRQNYTIRHIFHLYTFYVSITLQSETSSSLLSYSNFFQYFFLQKRIVFLQNFNDDPRFPGVTALNFTKNIRR